MKKYTFNYKGQCLAICVSKSREDAIAEVSSGLLSQNRNFVIEDMEIFASETTEDPIVIFYENDRS